MKNEAYLSDYDCLQMLYGCRLLMRFVAGISPRETCRSVIINSVAARADSASLRRINELFAI